MKKVSIIIPAYNKAEYTRQTVESVLAQTYPGIEIIVVDDGSSDTTPQVMAGYGTRIRYIRKANGGACSARNEGIRNASGEYVAFIDCDDLYHPEKIERCVDCLENNPFFGFVYTAASFIDQKGNIQGQYDHPRSSEGRITRRLILGNFICNSTVVVRRDVLAKAGFFDEKVFTPADWDMWLRLSQVSGAGYLKVPLTKYRVVDNYVFNKLELARKEEAYVLDKFFKANPAGALLKRAAYSNYYMRYAQCAYLKKDFKQFWSDNGASLRQLPWNLKTYVMALAAVFFPGWLNHELARRIIRHDQGD